MDHCWPYFINNKFALSAIEEPSNIRSDGANEYYSNIFAVGDEIQADQAGDLGHQKEIVSDNQEENQRAESETNYHQSGVDNQPITNLISINTRDLIGWSFQVAR